MAAFCKYCGKSLQDGEICSCPQAQAEAAQMYQSQQQPQQPPQGDYQQPQQPFPSYPQPPQQPAGPNPVVAALQKILPYLKSYVSAPISAAQDLVARKDMVFAAVLLCIQIIAGGLLPISLVSAYLNGFGTVYGGASAIVIQPFLGGDITKDITKSTEKSFSMFGDEVKFSASIPMSLVFGILAAAVAIAIFVVIAFAVSKIAGSNCTIQDAVIASAAHSPLVTVLLLLSFLFCFFSLTLGLILLLVSVLAWMVLAIPTFQALAPNAPQNKFWISAFAGILAALMIGGWAAYTIGSMSVDHATCEMNDKTYTVEKLRKELKGFF